MPKAPRKTRYPIESFDPRFRNIWLRAILNEVRIEFPTEREAQAFQARLQLYRAKLRDSGDPDAKALYRAKTSLQGKVLLIRPTDTAFSPVLDAFNKATAVPPMAGEADVDHSTATPLSVDDIFADLPPLPPPLPK